jgi:hypothetical protein
MEDSTMNPHLIVVSGRPFQCHCIKCGLKQWAGDVDGQAPVYADITGEPFKAYYCSPCAIVRSEELTAAGKTAIVEAA